MSFPVIYLGTIASFLVFDYFGLLHSSGRSAWSTFPADLSSVQNFQPPESSLRLVLFSFCVLMPALAVWRHFWKYTVFAPLALKCLGPKEEKSNHEKFIEQAWLAFHYFMVTALGVFVLSDKPWWPPLIKNQFLFATLKERVADQNDLGLQAMYAVQLSFYLLEFLTLLVERKTRKRSDVIVYFFHHIYTVVLMAGSWLTLDHRIGTLILILHDVGDIFLPIGKCFTYSESYVKKNFSKRTFQIVQFSGIFFFVCFIVAFAIPRIFVFGNLIYVSAYDHLWTTCCGTGVENFVCLGGSICPAPLYMALLVVVLMLLWPMHVFWLYLILKMAVKVVFGQYQDVRSDEDEPDASNKSKKKKKQ